VIFIGYFDNIIIYLKLIIHLIIFRRGTSFLPSLKSHVIIRGKGWNPGRPFREILGKPKYKAVKRDMPCGRVCPSG